VVLLLGLRPALKILVSHERNETPALPLADAQAILPQQATQEFAQMQKMPIDSENSRDQLNKLVNVDVDRAAQVLKKWLNDAERNAA
jgi:flagellar biosynthesis/type III secretory pathway M-ring protein FliF/YscJ